MARIFYSYDFIFTVKEISEMEIPMPIYSYFRVGLLFHCAFRLRFGIFFTSILQDSVFILFSMDNFFHKDPVRLSGQMH